MLTIALTAAIVIGDHVAMRATAERTSAQQAVLWKGDWLEVRGSKKGWLKVWDHRHERGGWVLARNVKSIVVEESSAPAVRAVVDFLRDTPGQESLGIAYAAIYLKVAPKGSIDAPVLISIGSMAERLARRASTAAPTDSSVAEQIAVARSWGIVLESVEQPDGAHICYDGAAFHGGLALAPGPADAANAILALTEPGCEPQGLGATARVARDEARLALLERVSPTQVNPTIGNQIRIRSAEIASQLAWATARRGDLPGAAKRAEQAFTMLARVDKEELAEDDAPDYAAAAVGVAASRWAALPALPITGLSLKLVDGEPGETCVTLVPRQGASSEPKCTHGQVWAASLRASSDRKAAVIAVEPLPGWLELWIFRRGDDGGWMVDVLAPNTDGPDRGYVELAGFSPDGAHALLVRESRTGGVVRRSFEAITLGTLAVDRQSSNLGGVGVAKRWASAEWRQRTVALR
ncbi:hypothetical protein BH11MYX3_BH11MYX3_34780 [soil metagenome]